MIRVHPFVTNSQKALRVGQYTQWESSRLRSKKELGSQLGGCVRQRERGGTA